MTARDEGAGTMEVNLGRFVLQEHELTGLHPRTAKLVRTFAFALAGKLRKAEQKYGYSDGWTRGDWEAECRTHLHEHVSKGDPLDVAAYSAFCWFHKWSTAAPVSAPGMDREEEIRGPHEPAALGLNGPSDGEEFLEFKEALSDLRSLRHEYECLNGGGPGWSARNEAAWARVNELFAEEDEAAYDRQQEDAHG